MDNKKYVEKLLDTKFEGVSKPETKSKLESIDLEMALLNSPDEYIHERIGTIDCNKFERKDKTKSGEYVLSRPPKKPGGKEVNDIFTVPTATIATVSTLKQNSQTTINTLERKKVPDIVQIKKHHDIIDEFAWIIGVTTNQLQFMTGGQIRERSEMIG